MEKREMGALLFAIAIGLVAATSANAGLVSLYSVPNDLPELSDVEYFTCGIYFNNASDKITTGEMPTFANIRGWNSESDDDLFVHMPDNIKWDSKNYIVIRSGGDNSAGNWPAPLGGKPQNFNLLIGFGEPRFLSVLNAYAKTIPGTGKVNFGFGIDHDRNYYNDGMTSTINTETQTPITYTP